MKPFTLIISFLFAVTSISRAQGVRDMYPTSSIYVLDYQSGQQVLATNDNAILFKNALINLVTNSNAARLQIRIVPGKKNFIITQADIKTGYSYQIVYQSVFLKQITTIYTFLYSIDQNVLYYFNPGAQNWLPEQIQGANAINLNNALELSKFNAPVVTQSDQNNTQAGPGMDQNSGDNAPVDTSVYTSTVPPALPDYDQPECPEDGYLWQPGYWAYSTDTNGYYWVPGVWVAPPSVGLLWTPPYWGFDGGRYIFHTGYWGNSIGFYGGINYGYGYGGVGFVGGNWYQGHFRYNTFVVRVGGRVHNTYVDNTVIINRNINHTSFNGRGGIIARPSEREMAAMHERHIMATSEQIRNQRAARNDRTQFASSNNGRPGNLAAERAPVRNTNFNNGQRPGGNGSGNGRPGNPGGNNPGNPGGNNPGNPNPGGQRPGNPGGNNPGNPNPGGQRPGNPGGNNPGNPNPGGQRPGNPNPGGNNPGNPNPGGQRPGNPGGSNPGNPNPGGQRPGNPGGNNPGNPNPGGQRPGNPGGNNPGGAKPGTNAPGKTIPPAPRPKTPPAKSDPPKKSN